MSFYDETLKARHEDDMDEEYGDVGGYGSGSTEEDYDEEEEESIGAEGGGGNSSEEPVGGEDSAPVSAPAPKRSGGGGGGKKAGSKKETGGEKESCQEKERQEGRMEKEKAGKEGSQKNGKEESRRQRKKAAAKRRRAAVKVLFHWHMIKGRDLSRPFACGSICPAGLGVNAAQLNGVSDAADCEHVRRNAVVHFVRLGEVDYILKGLAQDEFQLFVHGRLFPEISLAVLHPLKIGSCNAARVSQNIRDNKDPFVGKDLIGRGSGGAVRAFTDDFCLDARGILAGDYVFGCGRNENFAFGQQQLLGSAASAPGKPTMVLLRSRCSSRLSISMPWLLKRPPSYSAMPMI